MGLCEWLLAEGAPVVCALLTATAYDDGSGAPPWGVTASGTATRPGVAACGPSWAFGTVIVLPEAERVAVCEDRGGQVGDRDVDLWMPTRREALGFGRRSARAIIIEEAEGRSEGERAGLAPGNARAAASHHAGWRGNAVAEAVPGTRLRSIPDGWDGIDGR